MVWRSLAESNSWHVMETHSLAASFSWSFVGSSAPNFSLAYSICLSASIPSRIWFTRAGIAFPPEALFDLPPSL